MSNIQLIINELPKPKGKKKWLDQNIIEPIPFKYIVTNGTKIYTYGYCHTYAQAEELGNEALKIRRELKDTLLSYIVQ